MNNKKMEQMLALGVALSVRAEGNVLQEGVFQLRRYVEGKVYCDPVREIWIGSIGQAHLSNKIYASYDARYSNDVNYGCLFNRVET